MRDDFMVGIAYTASIPHAQQVALDVLSRHPAVLADPEPWVLVDAFGKSTVNLRVYFWLDIHRTSMFKVRSSLIRLIKLAFQENGIGMPDEAREVIFPEGVPVRFLEQADGPLKGPSAPVQPDVKKETDSVTVAAESGLQSEAGQLQEQIRKRPEIRGSGANLLDAP